MRRERRSLAIGTALLLMIGVTAPAKSASSATTAPVLPQPAAALRLAAPHALRGFFASLAALEFRRARRPPRILQIGDSHTANDAFSGRLRERLQQRFGAAGRGWLPAGIPYAYFRPQLVTVEEAGWRHFRPADAGSGVPLGIDASAAQSTSETARMKLTSTEAEGFDRFAIEFAARPNSAPLRLRIDGAAPIRVSTASPTLRPRQFALVLPRPAHQAELASAAQNAALVTGWAAERRRPGIIYENHGTIGATIALIKKINPAVLSFELATRRPALIIVAFGTNEGFEDRLDLSGYAARFRAALARLHENARTASGLVLGPPDGERGGAGCAPAKADAALPPSRCHAGGAETAGGCAWQAPPNLAAVRAIERRIALPAGWAFWDWSAAMGGECGIDRLVMHDPPLAMPDHVHLTKAGYAAAADLLYADLMREYERWKDRRRRR